MSMVLVLPSPLRRRVGVRVGSETRCLQLVRRSLRWTLGALLVLASGWANAKEGEWSWRIFDNDDEETLAITDTDLAGDNIKMPLIYCKKAEGRITVRGDADESLRLAMADVIRGNREPAAKLAPAGEEHIELFFVESWQYRIRISADAPPFEQFKKTGVLQFKLGKATVREKFTVGLENIAKFQEICRLKRRPIGQ